MSGTGTMNGASIAGERPGAKSIMSGEKDAAAADMAGNNNAGLRVDTRA